MFIVIVQKFKYFKTALVKFCIKVFKKLIILHNIYLSYQTL
jgi:hypothetical protein